MSEIPEYALNSYWHVVQAAQAAALADPSRQDVLHAWAAALTSHFTLWLLHLADQGMAAYELAGHHELDTLADVLDRNLAATRPPG